MQEVLRIGVIGAGRIGRVHAATLAQRVRAALPVMIADVNEEAARQTALQYGIPRAVSDYRELLENKEIDAVAICTPTSTHARMAQEAALAGKHVFCEKPIALTLPEIDCVLQAVENAGIKFQVGFNRRFDANFRRIRQAIESGEIGEPSLMHIVSRDPAPPPIGYVRTSGGMFLDMTIHDFDMARFLMGDDVEELFTLAAVRVDPAIGEAGDVDTAVIALKFAGGAIGTIDNSRRASYGYDQRVEVLGSRGAVETMNNFPNQAIISDGTSVRRDLPLNFFMDRYTDSFQNEMEAFVDAVVKDRAVPVAGRDGRVPVVMALAAALSHRERRPVRLSEIQ
jgi:myo-inositol 2-dehydrogenase/D-chiro-inositol 1-dehydrogenase